MATKKPTAAASVRKTRQSKRPLTETPAKSYAPNSTGGLLGVAMSAVLDNKPPFTYLFVPRMLKDPMVGYALNQLVGPLTMVEFEIRAKSEEVKGFVENTLKKFWRRSMPILAANYFCYGYAPGIHQIDQSEAGEYRYERCRWVDPPDAVAVKWSEGESRGELAGFRLIAGVEDQRDGDLVLSPFAAWYAGRELARQFYDHPRLATAYEPWLEKNTRAGALPSRKVYFHTQAFRGQVIYYPTDKYIDPQDPSQGTNRDFALYLADTLRSGSNLVFPDVRTPGEGRNESAWRIEPIESNATAAVDMIEYCGQLDKEILLGMGIPPELVEAAETGSGFSGRQIPMLGFMTQTDLLVGPMVGCIEPAIREMVKHNYDGAEFTLDTVPLAETVKRQNEPKAKSAVGGMAPAGGMADPQAADAQMAGSGGGSAEAGGVDSGAGQDAGGGDPTGGGLVPYLGKKGGRGKKDPRTGRVYYLSHGGERYGALMAEIPDPLASACLAFAATIPDEHLTEAGREAHPHVTVRWGFESVDPNPVFDAVGKLGSLSFQPGELRVFENDGADVLYVSCADPHKWHSWHRATEGCPCESSDHPYEPHITLAFLKKGKGEKYAGKRVLAGSAVPVSEVVYSGPDGRDSRMTVWPSESELAEVFNDRLDLAWKQDRSATGGLKAVWDNEGGVQKKPQYGENARRALAGESLIARRPGEAPFAQKVPVAERLPTAKRVDLPKVGPGQKLVRATDYREGMEPPEADRPRDALDREIDAENKKPLPVVKPKLPVAKPVQKQPPVAKRLPNPPQLAKRAPEKPQAPEPPKPPPPPKPPAPPAPPKAPPKPPTPKAPQPTTTKSPTTPVMPKSEPAQTPPTAKFDWRSKLEDPTSPHHPRKNTISGSPDDWNRLTTEDREEIAASTALLSDPNYSKTLDDNADVMIRNGEFSGIMQLPHRSGSGPHKTPSFDWARAVAYEKVLKDKGYAFAGPLQFDLKNGAVFAPLVKTTDKVKAPKPPQPKPPATPKTPVSPPAPKPPAPKPQPSAPKTVATPSTTAPKPAPRTPAPKPPQRPFEKSMFPEVKPPAQKPTEATPPPAPETPPEPKAEPEAKPEPMPASKVANGLKKALSFIPHDTETAEAVAKLDEAEAGGYLREAMFGLWTQYHDSPARKGDTDDKFRRSLLHAMNVNYGVSEVGDDNSSIHDFKKGFVNVVPGSRVKTGQIKRWVRKPLVDGEGLLRVPGIAEVD